MTADNQSDASFAASKMTHTAKQAALANLNEDEFRDKVIRPLFTRMGMTHLRETCGPQEMGKDCIFVSRDPLGNKALVAVQTKVGPVVMSGTGEASKNAVNIVTQLRTAIAEPVVMETNAERMKVAFAYLCTNGKISHDAREFLVREVRSPHVVLLGSDEIVPLIDQHFDEFWLGVGAERSDYARTLRRRLCEAQDIISFGLPERDGEGNCPALDGNYIPLRLSRMDQEITHSTVFKRIPGSKPIRVTEKRAQPKFVDVSLDSIAVEKTTLALILGEGGSGKTTALRRMAMRLIDDLMKGNSDPVLPVLLTARQAASGSESLLDVIRHETALLSNGQSPLSPSDYQKGKVCVLVDALEELELSQRAMVVKRLIEFHGQFRKCPILVTARDYKSILSIPEVAVFTHYRVMPIGLREADKLIERAIQRTPESRDVLKSALRKLHHNHGMALSPMLVTVFVSSSDGTKQDLPPNIAEIFGKFTEQMLGRWDQTKGLSQQYEAPLKVHLLGKLAFGMHKLKVRTIEARAVRAMIDEAIVGMALPVKSDAIFDEIVIESGMLKSDGETVEWRHHLLQEYFAGIGVPDAAFFQGVASEEWWRTPMVFHFGSRPTSIEQLKAIMTAAEELDPATKFEAGVSVGLAVQACYLAQLAEKLNALTWVMAAFANGMEAHSEKINQAEGGAKETLSKVCTFTLGRDAIATRILAQGPEIGNAVLEAEQSASGELQERLVAWRIVGLLEARELQSAIELLESFKPEQREIIFMLHLSVAWALHLHDPDSKCKSALERYLRESGELIDDLRQKLFSEFRSLVFEYRSGKLRSALDPVDENPANAPAALETRNGGAAQAQKG